MTDVLWKHQQQWGSTMQQSLNPEPRTVHHFAAGVYVREMDLLAGQSVQTHAHKYDHLSILGQGSVEVYADGVTTHYTAPTCILIKAGIEHGLFALSDSTWFCAHAADEEPIEALDVKLTKEGD